MMTTILNVVFKKRHAYLDSVGDIPGGLPLGDLVPAIPSVSVGVPSLTLHTPAIRIKMREKRIVSRNLGGI
jgi:hypothetical protein